MKHTKKELLLLIEETAESLQRDKIKLRHHLAYFSKLRKNNQLMFGFLIPAALIGWFAGNFRSQNKSTLLKVLLKSVGIKTVRKIKSLYFPII
ncbi:MAG: hypothetical protein H0U73_08565 [Tatlockia sp.]|nr:hypothetical protein [Tatlockia sp.]